MSDQEIVIDPVQHITVDAIGKPGERIFYIQARYEAEVLSLLVEKVQVQSLSVGIDQFLAEIQRNFPDRTEASPEYDEPAMHLKDPIDPLFHVGELGLAYDPARDRVCLVAREILQADQTLEDVRVVRLWCTRSQLRALSVWGLEVSTHGRPICPQCGEPMDPDGHLCPKKNGHKH